MQTIIHSNWQQTIVYQKCYLLSWILQQWLAENTSIWLDQPILAIHLPLCARLLCFLFFPKLFPPIGQFLADLILVGLFVQMIRWTIDGPPSSQSNSYVWGLLYSHTKLHHLSQLNLNSKYMATSLHLTERGSISTPSPNPVGYFYSPFFSLV